MDSQRFDRISRSLAARTTRRQAMRQVGAGGVLGGVALALGAKQLQAQGPVQTCSLPIIAEVYVGPWLGTVYQGTLSLDIGATGAIDSGSFDTLDGQHYAVVGHAAGRGLDARVDLGNQQLLTLTGTAENAFELCQGAAAGSFMGPEMGNMGTWITVDGMTLVGSGGPGITPSGTQTPTPNPCAAVSCLEPQVPSADTCECVCPGGELVCGGACCGAGQECADPTTSTCQCIAGMQPCGDQCIGLCSEIEYLDEISCLCVPYCPDANCTPGQTLNMETCECEDLPLCPGGTVACGSICADLENDPEHCGSCDHQCPWMPTADDLLLPSLCVAGDCCLDTDHLCAADGDCCSGSCDFISGGLQVCA
ncbi:MAG: hypothetical protein R2848_02355 [Thermomicrobiales bacterium]